MTQKELNFACPVIRRKHGGQCARRLIVYLAATGVWQTRADVRNAIGLTDRECRLAVEAAHGRIIFGQTGYRLTRKATLEEIDACSATIISQIQALQKKHKQLMTRRYKNADY